MKNKILNTVVIFLLFTTIASATSAGVSPTEIKFNGTLGETYQVNFTVVNTGNDITDYEILSRGDITNWTTFDIQKVTLDGKNILQTVAYITIPNDADLKIYKGDILIKSIPSDAIKTNKVSVMVNLPVTIEIKETSSNVNIYIIILILIILMLISSTILRRPRK